MMVLKSGRMNNENKENQLALEHNHHTTSHWNNLESKHQILYECPQHERKEKQMVKRKNLESTSKPAASAAGRTLRNPNVSKAAKSAAGSALSQRKSTKVTGSKAGSAASKTLRNPSASKSAKSAAGSTLTQRPNRKK